MKRSIFRPTTGKIMVLLGAAAMGALVYSEKKLGVDETALSPLVKGQAVMFTIDGLSAQKEVSTGESKLSPRVGTASWHYRWKVSGTPPVTDDVILSELFKQPGSQPQTLLQRGAPGTTIKADYKTTGGYGVVTWKIKAESDTGPWTVDMNVQEGLDWQPKDP